MKISLPISLLLACVLSLSLTSSLRAVDLLGYWNFDDNSNPAVAPDLSCNAPDATLAASAAFSADGAGHSGAAGDRSLDLGPSGNGAHALVPTGTHLDAAFNNNSMAVSFWQFNTGFANSSSFWISSIANFQNFRGFQAHVPWGNGTTFFDHSGCCGGNQRRTTGGAIANQWQHFVFQKDATGRKQIWIDGNLADDQVSGAAALIAFEGRIDIGRERNSVGNSIGGRIDEFAVFDGALTPAQIAVLAGGAPATDVILLAKDDTGATTDNNILTTVDPGGAVPSLFANDFCTGIALADFDATSAQGAAVNVNPDGTFTYDPTASPTLLALLPGQSIVDTFTYRINHSLPIVNSETANIALWLDSSDIDADGNPDTLLDGAAITTWHDKSGNNRDAVLGGGGGNDPNYRTSSSQFINTPVVDFDGNDQMITNHNFDSLGRDYSIFTVARYSGNNVTGGDAERVISSDTRNWLFGFWGQSVERVYFQGWVHQGPQLGANYDTNWQVHTGIVDGTPANPQIDFYRNGTQLAFNNTGSTDNDYKPGVLSLGAWTNNGQETSIAEIAEVIIYDRELNNEQRLAVEDYLNKKYFGTGATVTVTVSGVDDPLVATDDDYTTDEDTPFDPVTSLLELDGLATGDYSISADGETFDAHVDHDGTNGWLLIGRGRDGWLFDGNPATGQQSPASVKDNLRTPAGFAPAHLRDNIVRDLLDSIGADMKDVEIRLLRAGDNAGTGDYQEVIWSNFTGKGDQFSWDLDNNQYGVTSTYVNAPAGLPGANTGTFAGKNTRDSEVGGNDGDRIFTWPWGGHANRQGFSYGRLVNNGANNATSYFWENGNENHAIPYTEVYIRVTLPPKTLALLNDSDGDGDFFVSSVDTTGTLGVVNMPTGNPAGNGDFTYDPNGAFEYLNVGEMATDTFTYTISNVPPARFVRVQNNGGAIRRMDIGEVEVFAPGVTPPVGHAGGSGALNPSIDLATLANGASVHSQTASQPHGFNNTTIINGTENTGAIWSTNGVGNFVIIDLGSNQAVETVRVHQRNDGCCQDRLRDFTVSLLADDGTGNPGGVVASQVFPAQVPTNSFAALTFPPVGLGTDTATVTMTITGVNDPPTLTSPIPDQFITTGTPTLDLPLFPFFEDVDNDDDEQIYTVTINTNGTLIQTDPISSVDGILTINTPCTLIGSADITVQVEDTGGEIITDTFTVTVTDNVDPVISGAKDMFYNAPAGGTALANFSSVTVSDKVDASPSLMCSPDDSAPFPIGSTLITCTAEDASGNDTVSTFFVHVIEIQAVAGTRILDVVSLRDDVAPGGAGMPAGAIVRVHQDGVLNNAGDILYAASLSEAGTNDQAVFLHSGGSDQALAVRNLLAPGGANYGKFEHLAINDNGQGTFQSATSAGAGNFRHDGTTVSDAAVAGATAPGTTGEYRVLRKPAITSSGEVLTVSNLKTGVGGITSADDTGLWRSGSATPIAREGELSPIPLTDHSQIHPRVVASAAGDQIAYTSYLVEQSGFDGTDNTAIFAGPLGGTLALIVREGEASPGEPGVEIDTITAESVNSAGAVAFIGNVRGSGITSANNAGLWWSDGASLRTIAREGAIAPCLPAQDAVFARFRRLSNCDDGSVFFYAYLKPAGTLPTVNSTNDGSIWRWDSGSGALHLVARESQVALSTDGSQHGTLLDFDCNQVGGIVYLATMVSNIGDNTARVRDGVWLARDASDVAPVLVLRRGDNFLIDGLDHEVSNIELNAQSNPGGGTGGYGKVINDSGEILLNLSLNRNKSGLFKMAMP